MIRPTPRCVLLAVAGIPVALLPALLSERLWALWVAAVAAGLLAIGLDAVFLLRRSHLTIEVRPPEVLYIGEGDPLLLRLVNAAFRGARLEVLPELSELLEPLPSSRLALPARGLADLRVTLVPRRRGTARVHALWLRWAGPLGLVRRSLRHPTDLAIPVVPNVRAVRAAAIRFHRSGLAGLKTERYLGDGSEFESLREYRPGLDTRAMDWKASARHRKLIAREYRAERNHQIVLAFDTGHLMREPLEGIPRLDHAINAGLILAFAALKTGDRVGLFGFDERVRVFAEPRGGLGALARHQRLSSELEYSAGETNFTLGLMTLGSRLKRRTLVVLFTDFVDTVTVELMLENLERLTERHLVLTVTLSEPDLSRVASARPEDLAGLNRAVVAEGLLRVRDVVLRRLRRLGVLTIDAPARAVTAELIDRYLEVKRRELV